MQSSVDASSLSPGVLHSVNALLETPPCGVGRDWFHTIPTQKKHEGERVFATFNVQNVTCLRTSVPIWKFFAKSSTDTKHKQVCCPLVLVRLLPRRAEIPMMSMCHALTTQDTRGRFKTGIPCSCGRRNAKFPGVGPRFGERRCSFESTVRLCFTSFFMWRDSPESCRLQPDTSTPNHGIDHESTHRQRTV